MRKKKTQRQKCKSKRNIKKMREVKKIVAGGSLRELQLCADVLGPLLILEEPIEEEEDKGLSLTTLRSTLIAAVLH